ncbi:ras guanine nucleotide exchange factor domain-containing protein [Dichotomopilus funicola]|uniref:Ras guanine nucleotide exchange factor domain-containing protein n=1 Tax=Dichotomopilus funicola TaxID=1934379 RepID=A0AAN6ZLK6_9PEZI|nr:ras guanine nucleotide exchange factor domain-containing protein [Dichotomopilus funicola]
MWAQTHPSVSGRTGGALPQASERPSLANNVTPLRAGGTGAGAGPAGPAASGAAPSGPATSNATTRTNNHPSLPQLPTIVGSGGTFLLVDDLPTAESRDSFASIVEDPFFFRYHTPGLDPEPEPCRAPASASAPTAAPEPALRSALPSAPSTSAGHRDEERQPWIPPRKESLSHSNPTPWHASAPSDMEPINIAIIGAVGVGKSTFIQQLRRAPRPSALNITTLRQEVDGAPYLVTLVELDLEGIELDPNQPVHWPKQIGGHSMPRMDGALILYDAVNEGSMREVPPIMAALDNSSLPTLLVATKCDTPDDLRHPDLSGLAQAFATCAGHLRTASNAPASARECLQTMLRVALANRKDKSEGGGGHRRRAASTANLDAPMDPHNGRPISQHSKHSRASSDFSLLRGFSQPASESQFRGPAPRSPRPDYQSTSSSNLSHSTAIPEDGGPPTVSNMLRTPGIRLDGGGETFLDVDESDGESYRSDDIPILQRSDDGFDKPVKLAGVSFGELVDRLLAPKMSKSDQNFADVFLCLYRKFSTPSGLLAAIRARLDQLWTGRGGEYLLKIEAQMRIIEVAAKWLSLYPGDFARPATRRSLEELIKQLSTDPVFVAAAQQMRAHLEQKVTVDDDTSWAKSDPDEDQQEGGGGGGGGGADQRQSGMAESMGSLHLDGSTLASARRPSQSSDLSGIEPRGAQGPARLQFHSVEDYEAEAATLIPSGILPLNKYRYHLFMELDVDDIANEMTRIDWIMFSSIRIRDMVRHVSLSHDAKTKCRHLKNVDRMVSHFNHVAQWVANIVLLRDKAKHRAPCLEKLMSVALRLRQMNNYNGLAAVLAGINGTAVHRLASTRSLVTASVQKRFAGLELLMGTQKSHFAYRLAWENSPLPRIPFMPLHRRDLVSAEEGSKTFVGSGGDRVNWKKFEVLGEVLLPIMKSQGQPYPNLSRNDVCKELVLDCRMSTDDEDIYQRSLQVEPTSGSGGALEATRKKFPWLAK